MHHILFHFFEIANWFLWLRSGTEGTKLSQVSQLAYRTAVPLWCWVRKVETRVAPPKNMQKITVGVKPAVSHDCVLYNQYHL